MVKIPQAAKSKIRFRDEHGRFVKQEERYQKAVKVEKLFRGKWETIAEGKKVITPKRLVDILNRNEFESLAPNYSSPTTIKPTARKYTAWDAANKIGGLRGIKGHMMKVTMNIRDGDRLRKISFYRRVSRKKKYSPYGMFRQMNQALGNEKLYLYNRIGSKLLPDRKGKSVHLESIEVSKEL